MIKEAGFQEELAETICAHAAWEMGLFSRRSMHYYADSVSVPWVGMHKIWYSMVRKLVDLYGLKINLNFTTYGSVVRIDPPVVWDFIKNIINPRSRRIGGPSLGDKNIISAKICIDKAVEEYILDTYALGKTIHRWIQDGMPNDINRMDIYKSFFQAVRKNRQQTSVKVDSGTMTEALALTFDNELKSFCSIYSTAFSRRLQYQSFADMNREKYKLIHVEGKCYHCINCGEEKYVKFLDIAAYIDTDQLVAQKELHTKYLRNFREPSDADRLTLISEGLCPACFSDFLKSKNWNVAQELYFLHMNMQKFFQAKVMDTIFANSRENIDRCIEKLDDNLIRQEIGNDYYDVLDPAIKEINKRYMPSEAIIEEDFEPFLRQYFDENYRAFKKIILKVMREDSKNDMLFNYIKQLAAFRNEAAKLIKNSEGKTDSIFVEKLLHVPDCLTKKNYNENTLAFPEENTNGYFFEKNVVDLKWLLDLFHIDVLDPYLSQEVLWKRAKHKLIALALIRYKQKICRRC